MDVSRGRHEAHRGPRRAIPERGPRGSRACAGGPGGRRHNGAPSWRAAAAPGATGLPLPARADTRFQGQRRGFEPVGQPDRGPPHEARAAAWRLRRRARPRADRATVGLAWDGRHPSAPGRHVPLVLDQVAAQHRCHRAGRAADAEPPARADRGVAGGRLDRAAVVRRRVPCDPQRCSHRRGGARSRRRTVAGRGAADRVRRSGGRAQGTAAPVTRVRGAARATAHRADRGRTLAAGARATGSRPPRDPRARQGRRRAQAPRAGRRRRAVRPVAGRRELRHGPDRGICVGHDRRRLRHRRLPRRRPRRRRRGARPAGRRAAARRGPARPVRRARAPRPVGAGCGTERPPVLVGPRRARGDGRLHGRDRDAAAARHAATRGRARRSRQLRSEATRPRAPTSEPRAPACGGRAQGRPRPPSPCRDGLDPRRRRRARVSGTAEDRDQQHRPRPDHLEPHVCAARARDDGLRDGGQGDFLARDPAGSAAARPRALGGRAPGHDDRRFDVIDASGQARRAVAGARGRAPDRTTAREPSRRARDARVPDGPQHRRAGDPRRDHVLVGRFLQRP